MEIRYTEIILPSANLGGENPLPVFRAEDPDLHIPYDETFRPEEAEMLGKNGATRVLPYLMQDRYDRNRVKRPIKACVMENEFLRAVILPDFGGRLYSLYDKEAERELLFANPVIQPANLAIRDAWLSGGVEWNVSQLGHTFTTCSPMFVATVRGNQDEDFVRVYEYERQKGLFWQVDFHLPDGSRELYVYVRIVNDSPEETPMYWWSTTAVPENASTRVLLSGSRAMYTRPATGVNAMGEMPYFPEFGPKDYSYTLNLKQSNDFFIQVPEEVKTPWEAAAYENGAVTFEKSTSLLHYRKIFCWGDRPGGWRWKEFLSEEGGGSYIEIQAGIARSQRHGLTMPGNTSWDFTTAFGGLTGDPARLHDRDWSAACAYLDGELRTRVSPAKLYGLHRKFASFAGRTPEKILHMGSGWGALEAKLRAGEGREIPEGFLFPADSMKEEQAYWLSLLENGALPDSDPASYLLDARAKKALEKSPASWQKYYHLGVIAAEVPDRETAVRYFSRSAESRPNVWALRALAVLSGDPAASEEYYDRAFALGFPDVGFAQEYLKLLVSQKKHAKAYDVYKSLPAEYKDDERVMISAVSASLALGDVTLCESGFFDRSFVNVREGDVLLSELWYYYVALKAAKDRGVKVTTAFLDWVKQTNPLPKNIDFRMK
ncbi:MAG: DUF5107 domain-containing protein [Clostridia bacterium]|nr:DUF5107 domain-containing protein [Clostridia bacterium]